MNADQRMPRHILQAIRNPENSIYLSVASVWEVVIKSTNGKLNLPEPSASYVIRKRELHQITSLPIDEESMLFLNELPLLHRDPFDRIIVAQCIQHKMTLATIDSMIRTYPVPVVCSF